MLQHALRAAAAVAILAASQAALAQNAGNQSSFLPQADQAPPNGPSTTPAGLPAADAKPKNWLMRSPLVDVGWPEIKMPSLRWKTAEKTGAAEKGVGPLKRVQTATHNAFSRTRTAWNKTVDKLKVGPFRPKQNDGQPGFFAKLFGGGEDKTQPETVAEFLKQDRPKLR